MRYPEVAPAYEGLISTLLLLRNGDAADSVAALARKRFPTAPSITLRAVLVSCFRERFAECQRGLAVTVCTCWKMIVSSPLPLNASGSVMVDGPSTLPITSAAGV